MPEAGPGPARTLVAASICCATVFRHCRPQFRKQEESILSSAIGSFLAAVAMVEVKLFSSVIAPEVQSSTSDCI